MAGIAVSSPGGLAESRVRTKRGVSTGSIAGGAEATVTITWDTAFADTNYTAVVSASANLNAAPQVERILTKTASAITVRVKNEDAVNAQTGTLEAIAIHD